MAKTQPPQDPLEETHRGRGGDSEHDPFIDVIALGRRGMSRPCYIGEVLRSIARFYRSPYAAIHLRYGSEVIQDDCHRGPTDPGFWKAGLQQFLTESLAEVRPRAKVLRSRAGRTTVALLSTPFFGDSGPVIGAIALVVTPIEDDDVSACLARLESLARLASASMGTPHGADAGARVSKGAMQAMARAAQCETPQQLAFAVTNELRNKIGCEQVVLGLTHRNRIEILSISGLDEVRKQSPGVVRLRGAMEECLDAGEIILCQRGEAVTSDLPPDNHRLHRQWREAAGGDGVASIPLRIDDHVVAVLSLRQRADQPFALEQVEQIQQQVEPFAPALLLTRRAQRGLSRHGMDSLRAACDTLTTSGGVGRKIATGAGGLFMLWFLFGTLSYELTVPAVVTAANVRHISAPFDGVLDSAPVVEGDHVLRGDELCAFDHRDLDQQRAEVQAELAVLESVMDKARSDESPYEVELARARQELMRAKLAIVDRRIQQATLTAPFDGVIVSGDLRKAIGSVLARGDPLFVVAPLDRWRIELAVPESSSADLAPELAGAFAAYARPGEARTFQISRVLAAAQPRDTKNVYIAEADIEAARDWLRPGMEGIAKIRIGRRPVWWITLHRAIDYIRMHLWL